MTTKRNDGLFHLLQFRQSVGRMREIMTTMMRQFDAGEINEMAATLTLVPEELKTMMDHLESGSKYNGA